MTIKQMVEELEKQGFHTSVEYSGYNNPIFSCGFHSDYDMWREQIFTINIYCEDNFKYNPLRAFEEEINKIMFKFNLPKIENVIFNKPATIVFWSDNTKTVVKAQDEAFDEEKGLAMAIAKKALGNQGNYFNEFKKWLPKIDAEPVK